MHEVIRTCLPKSGKAILTSILSGSYNITRSCMNLASKNLQET